DRQTLIILDLDTVLRYRVSEVIPLTTLFTVLPAPQRPPCISINCFICAVITPTRFGVMTAQMKQFIDMQGGLWGAGKTVNKVVSGMTSDTRYLNTVSKSRMISVCR